MCTNTTIRLLLLVFGRAVRNPAMSSSTIPLSNIHHGRVVALSTHVCLSTRAKTVLRLSIPVDSDDSTQSVKKYLSLRGSQVFYETSGEGELLLLLHGGFGTNEDFARQTSELAKHFKVVAFERPGHGHTADTDEPFSYSGMSEYTVDFIEALGLGPSNLVGWSDGAIIALLIAISRPDLVKRLVSIGGSFNPSGLPAKDQKLLASATPESFRKFEPLVTKRYDGVTPDGPGHFSVVFEKTKKMWLTEPNIQREELARITAPTLVMAGDRDVISHEHTLELFKSIKNAQLSIIPGTTHFLLDEKPKQTTNAILDFLLADKKSR
jgi:pimeloyl-ACP methyl ester carboxylesterase